ncbi:hypothetical protein B0H63DRAFT_469423 [Podospora didyma]|uniref:Uncharacterized protein n=1 Tax=Podospora didyma TaxID=330526 RepID=A0AAE0NT27_9PEZI|nr:hypothetical protein B0H63DRAFT_469423 [Podospora didyma]
MPYLYITLSLFRYRPLLIAPFPAFGLVFFYDCSMFCPLQFTLRSCGFTVFITFLYIECTRQAQAGRHKQKPNHSLHHQINTLL